MSTITANRDTYKLGKLAWGNREVITYKAGEETDLPAGSLVGYGTVATQFPYQYPQNG